METCGSNWLGAKVLHVRPTTGTDNEMDDAPILDVVALSKKFGGVTAVQDVSLDVPRGGILSIIGPNGAGKATSGR